jgi:hypothetical protein
VSHPLSDALFFNGVECAADTHAVCVLDAAGTIAAEFMIIHSADGIAMPLSRGASSPAG